MGKKEDILMSTINLIANEGVMQATIGNILKQASTGYGTLYNYYDSKEDLYLAAYKQIIKNIEDYLDQQTIVEGNLEQVTQHLLLAYINFALDNDVDFRALEAIKSIPGICEKSKSDTFTNTRFLTHINRCEVEGVFKLRAYGYNINMLMGMIATFIRYVNDSGMEVDNNHKEDLVISCMNALK